MRKNDMTRRIVQAAMIAALYVGLTYAVAPIAYGSLQFRISEALTILPVFTPAAIPGLTIGCLLANLGSPYGLIDIVCGTAATLIAAIITYLLRRVRVKGLPILAPLPPILVNALIIGAEIAVFLPEGFSFAGFALAALQVGFGELVVCYALGLPLAAVVQKTSVLKW